MPFEAPASETPPSSTEDWHRLHGATLALRVSRHARALILPAIIVLFLAREGSPEYWLAAMFVPSVLYELLKYLTLRYRFTDEDLILRQGLLFRNERHIRFRRIQNIDIVQGPLQRLLGGADVKIETASGSEPEAQLQVLSLEAVAMMRQRVFAGDTGETSVGAGAAAVSLQPAPSTSAEGPRRVVLRIPTAELVTLGLISNRGMVLILIAAGFLWEFDLAKRIELDWLFESVAGLSLTAMAAAGAVMLIGALLSLRVLSVAWTILRFHGYVLERVGEDLRVRCGLLTRTSATVPRHRVQFLSVHQTLLARWMGRATIRLETAGSETGEESDAVVSGKWFVPIVRQDQVLEVVGALFPDLDLEDLSWRRLAPRARGRMLRVALIVALLATLGCLLLIRPWGVLTGVVWVPLAVWHALASFRLTAWARAPVGLAFRSGVVTRKVSVTFYDKMQVITLKESPFDRRHDMASLRVDTAGAGPADHKIDIPYLPRAVARRQLDDLFERAQQTAFRI